jgi:hypothetical protein
MNNVIHFRPANNPRRMASGNRGAAAQILFFTGVRYQRWSEDAHAPQLQAQNSRRKRVQIAETGRERKSQR